MIITWFCHPETLLAFIEQGFVELGDPVSISLLCYIRKITEIPAWDRGVLSKDIQGM